MAKIFTQWRMSLVATVGVLAAGISAQAAPIFNETFDNETKASLVADGWVFNDQNRAAFLKDGTDWFLQLTGDSSLSAAPRVDKPFGADVQAGTFHAVLGSTNSVGNITLRLMDGSTELLSLQIPNRITATVNSKDKTDTYTDTNITLNTFDNYANRLEATFSWQVNSDGTGSTFSYTLTQPDPNHQGTVVVNTGSVAGRSFLANGVPDRIELELGSYNAASRGVRLYQLDVQTTTVPEPGMSALLGAICAGGMLRRR